MSKVKLSNTIENDACTVFRVINRKTTKAFSLLKMKYSTEPREYSFLDFNQFRRSQVFCKCLIVYFSSDKYEKTNG